VAHRFGEAPAHGRRKHAKAPPPTAPPPPPHRRRGPRRPAEWRQNARSIWTGKFNSVNNANNCRTPHHVVTLRFCLAGPMFIVGSCFFLPARGHGISGKALALLTLRVCFAASLLAGAAGLAGAARAGGAGGGVRTADIEEPMEDSPWDWPV